MSVDRLLFPRPDEERIYVTRQSVTATCPRCGSGDIARYPVANYIGPKMVSKCQACFYHLSIDEPTGDDAWPPWRAAARDWPSSRAG